MISYRYDFHTATTLYRYEILHVNTTLVNRRGPKATFEFQNIIWRLFIWEAGRDFCPYGTLNGILPCMYISHIYHVPFIWKECLPGRFRPIAAKRDPSSLNRDPGKSGTIFIMFLSLRRYFADFANCPG